MPLPRSCALSRPRPEANLPTRDRLSFRAARKVRRRVSESAAQSGSVWSVRPNSVRGLMAFLDLLWTVIYLLFLLLSLPL